MKHLYLLLFLCTLFTLSASAQGHVVRGKITDENGQGIPGATIIEVDANDRVINGSISDYNGNYSMKFTRADAIAKYSFIGYKTIVENINGRTEVNVQLGVDATELEEIVIVGKGPSSSLTGVAERDRTGSSVNIKMDELIGSSVISVGDALQGEVAGLDIMSGGGPGSGSSIVIRGLGSLGNSNPLVVVDGIAQKVSTSDIDFGSADAEDIGLLVSVAPEDIKSIRVLKDAAETAIWGSQGANGVLEIETRSGIRGKTRFDISYKSSLAIEPPTIPMLNGDEYLMLQHEMWHNANGIFQLPDEIAYDRDFIDYYNYSQNTDWIGAISRTGKIDDFGFGMTGGGDKTSYYASVNYQNNIGTVINTSNRRLTSRINLDYKISNKLTLTTRISYVNIFKEDNWRLNDGSADSESNNGIRRIAYAKAPNMAIYEHDSEGVKSDEFFTPITSYQGDGTFYYNPVAVGELSENDISQNDFQTNFVLTYRVNNWIRLKETVSFQFQNIQRSQFLPYTAIGARWLDTKNNWASERNTSGTLLTTRSSALLTPITTKTHHLQATLLWETNQNVDEYIQTNTGNGPSVYLTDPATNTTRNGITSYSSENNSVGALAQILYKLKDKYIIELSTRVDANSRFGDTFRWGLFPSAAFAWRFSEEEFIKNLGYFGDSKLRVSYGRAGSSGVRAYDRHGIYSDAGSGGTYMNMSTIIPIQVELERLKWEMQDMLNIGLDISMFRERLYVSANFYDKKTTDMLWKNYDLPSSSGYRSLKQYNEGELKNRGWEFNTRFAAIKKQDLSLTLNFNIYNNQNTFIEFPANLITEQNIELGNGNYPLKAEVGTPVGSFFGFRYLGVYPTTADAIAYNADGTKKLDANGNTIPMNYNGDYQFEGGDAKYEDINHDGIIDLNDVVYLGDSNPDFAGGLGISLKYKKLTLSPQFLYRWGYQIVNEIAMDTESMSGRNNQSTAVLSRWRRPGQDFPGMLPRAYQNSRANNLGSDRYVENGDFLRLNSLSINYSFGKKVLNMLHLRSLRVGFIGRKLYTFTRYTGQDPEIKTRMTNPFWFGTDDGLVPPPKIYSISINVGF